MADLEKKSLSLTRPIRSEGEESDILFATTVEILCNGKRAGSLLQQLELHELNELANKMFENIEGLPLPPVDGKEALIQYNMMVFDRLASAEATRFTPGGLDEIKGTLDRDGKSVRGRIRHLADLTIPDQYKHFIRPTEHARLLHLPNAPIVTTAISSVLAQLHTASRENKRFSIDVDGATILAKDVVYYGGRVKKAYYSDPALSSYVVQQLALEFAVPEDKRDDRNAVYDAIARAGGWEPVRIDMFCTQHLHVHFTTYADKIRTIAQGILNRPEDFDDFPANPGDAIKIRRTANNAIIHISPTPEICAWFSKELGLYPSLPEKHDHLRSPSNTLLALGFNKNSVLLASLKDFLWKELLDNPSRVINEETGRNLKDAILTYRTETVGRRPITYLHEDIDNYLLIHWLSPKLHGDKQWVTTTELLRKNLGISHSTPAHTRALQELLGEIRTMHKDENIFIGGGNEKPVWDVVRRMSGNHDGIGYYVHRDAVEYLIECGWLTKEKIQERAQAMKTTPSDRGL